MQEGQCKKVIANLATATPTDFHQTVKYVKNQVKSLVLAKLDDQELFRVSQVVLAVQHEGNYLISAILQTEPQPTTSEDLRNVKVSLSFESKSSTRINFFSAINASLTQAHDGNPTFTWQAPADRCEDAISKSPISMYDSFQRNLM